MSDEQTTLSWDDSSIIVAETISEDDIKNAETLGSSIPVGKYLCTCVDSVPRQMDFKAYSCIGANLKWRIDRVVELGEKKDDHWIFVPVKDDRGEDLEGRFIYDTINMPAPGEKDGMRKRRILVAKRCELIDSTTGEITKRMWSHDIIGKKSLLTVVENRYTDKSGNEKTRNQVDFSGYDYSHLAERDVSTDDFSDV